MPEKMVARMTEMKVKKADAVPKMARVLNVRGSDAKKDTTATMALKPMVSLFLMLKFCSMFDGVRLRSGGPSSNVTFLRGIVETMMR